MYFFSIAGDDIFKQIDKTDNLLTVSPSWRAATQLDHCAAAPPALAVLLPCGICMAKKWRFWLLEHRGWGANTHLWAWWAHGTPGAWGLSLPFVIHGCTRGSTVHTLLPQNRVTDYHTLTLHGIWFSDIQVSSCAFFLNWNHSACFFPYSVTHFSIGKRFFFANWSFTLTKQTHSHRHFEIKYCAHLAPLDMKKTCSSKSPSLYLRITHFLNCGNSFSYYTPCSCGDWENSTPWRVK